MTMKQKIASGRRSAGSSNQDEAFFDVDPFTEYFPQDKFNVLLQTIYCMAHGIGNNINDLFSMILNNRNKPMFYTQARRTYEQETLNRFQFYTRRERMPWMTPVRTQAKLVHLENRRVLKVPTTFAPAFSIADGVPSKVYIVYTLASL